VECEHYSMGNLFHQDQKDEINEIEENEIAISQA
jgi:hypothetical protein